MNSNGGWIKPAIVDIIKVKDEHERFLADVSVCGFIAEQNTLDTFLFDNFKQGCADLLKLSYLQTQGGNLSKAKVIAFMYQHEETTVMDIVRSAVVEHGKTLLANIQTSSSSSNGWAQTSSKKLSCVCNSLRPQPLVTKAHSSAAQIHKPHLSF
jgi:hypothetical protein